MLEATVEQAQWRGENVSRIGWWITYPLSQEATEETAQHRVAAHGQKPR